MGTFKLSDYQGTTDTGSTPLCVAAEEGQLAVIRFLVESGANKDQGKTDTGATLLFITAQNGHLEVVRLPRHHRYWINASLRSS